MSKLSVVWFDADTNEEIAGFTFDFLDAVPRVGDEVHYWVDTFPRTPDPGEDVRRDFTVVKVRHDLRYSDPGNGRQVIFTQTVEVWLRPLAPAAKSA